jgi:hypothetical protein
MELPIRKRELKTFKYDFEFVNKDMAEDTSGMS